MISEYFLHLRASIEEYNHIIFDFSTSEKIYSSTKGFIDGEIVFSDESKLEFAEVKDLEILGKIKYRYHYMDMAKQLIFRYDNAKHYPTLLTFPHHKHIINNVIESVEPTLSDILSEIERKVI